MKRGPARSKKYMEWIRKKRCVVTGFGADIGATIHAHHITVSARRGLGQKPSDYWCVPLSAPEHQQLHHEGERAYWERVKPYKSPHQIAAWFLFQYMEQEVGLNPKLILEHLEQLMEEHT